jgi:diaminohydroxyphosphoribosylaminopyrimidine deaminase/5-amino-6-(5-phosphoribosylamino)uracil reductase
MDNPQLTARYYFGKNPVRMVLDRTLRLPGHLHVFDQQAPTVVFTQQTQVVKTNITFAQIPFRNAPFEIMEYCYQNNIQSIIVEGGSKLLQSFIEANLWDEARVFKGDVIFENGIKAPTLNAKPRFNKRFENSTLFFYFNDEWDAIANIDYL